MKEHYRKNKKGGFTLVELIVVLVILAILAAIMIPSLIGWINKAKQKKLILECRSAVQAAQGLYSEGYAFGRKPSVDDIRILAKTDGEISGVEDTDYTVVHLTYTKDGESVTYCRNYETCGLHSETYHFADAESSGGGDAGAGGSGSGGSGSGGSGGGNSVSYVANGETKQIVDLNTWGKIYAAAEDYLDNNPYNAVYWPQKLVQGTVYITDTNDAYIYAWNGGGVSVKRGDTVANMIANTPAAFVKINTESVYTTDSLQELWNDMVFDDNNLPKAGSIFYKDEATYVALRNVDKYETNVESSGNWAKLVQ